MPLLTAIGTSELNSVLDSSSLKLDGSTFGGPFLVAKNFNSWTHNIVLSPNKTSTTLKTRLPYILLYKLLPHISRPPPKKWVPMWSKIADPCISRRWFWGLVLHASLINNQLNRGGIQLTVCNNSIEFTAGNLSRLLSAASRHPSNHRPVGRWRSL